MSANQAFEASRVESQVTSSMMVLTGRIISGLVILFLAFDGIGKVVKEGNAVQGTVDLGYPESLVIWIGLALTVCTVLYAIPRTAILGAILLTGYLGGAIATQVRHEDPWLLFPAGLAVLVWAGLYLRSERVRAFLA